MGTAVNFKDNTANYSKSVSNNLKDCIEDVARDVRNTARGAAPHLKGQLEKGINYKVTVNSSKISAVIDAAAYNRGYNYAKHMHDGNYKLGAGSSAKAGGK